MEEQKQYSRKKHLNSRIQRAKNNFWNTLKGIDITNFNPIEFDY